MSTLKGRCHCGEIQFEVSNESVDQLAGIYCHCTSCQHMHSNSSYNIKTAKENVKITSGKTAVFDDKSGDTGKAIHRHFCPRCSSAVFSYPDVDESAAFVKVGALDQAGQVKPKAEIYVESALAGSLPNKSQVGKLTSYEGFMAKEVERA